MLIITSHTTPPDATLHAQRGRTSPITLEFLKHLFHGTGCGGYHHEGGRMREMFGVKVREGTREPPDGRGVYRARVRLRTGRSKKKGSIFFPANWSRVRVLRAIKEAYMTRRLDEKGWYIGTSPSEYGLQVMMGLEGKIGEIVTAFPLPAVKRWERVPHVCKRIRERTVNRLMRNAVQNFIVHLIVINFMRSRGYDALFVQIEKRRRGK